MTKARVDQSATTDDLSESARAVVRDAGDPRIDAHLRALGLVGDPVERTDEAVPAGPIDPPELAALRTTVLELGAALAASERRTRWLAVALTVALVTVAALAMLLVVRPG